MARYRVGLETERRIVAATRELLAETGLEGTTLKAICERAEVQPGSFYNLFDSKEQLILRVVGESISAVDPHPQGVGTDTVDELVDAYIAFVDRQEGLARIYLQIAVGGGLDAGPTAEQFARHHQRRVERFAAAIQREDAGMGTAEAEAKAQVLLAALNGLAFMRFLDSSFDFPRHARLAAAEQARAS